jgi:hypothetical protein
MRHNAYPKIAFQFRQRQKGVALITALLLLLLLTGLTLAMAWSSSSDMLINSYYANFRGSFYAADSGLNIARQSLVNQLEAVVPNNFSSTVPPIPAGAEATVQANVLSQYGSAYQSIDTGSAASSWPEKFTITQASLTLIPDPVTGLATVTKDPKTGDITSYVYKYAYALTAIGKSRGTENTTLTDKGQLQLTANLKPATTNLSFAAYGMFIDQFSLCGGTLVPGTITGPVFTNGAWNFGTGGPYTFTDPIGSVNQDAGYQFSSGCDSIDGTSDTKGGTTIAPTFAQGFQRGQAAVPLPTNSFNQERAVLDGIGTNNTAPSNSELNAALKDAFGVAYPSGGTNTGVFLPYKIVAGARVFTGGGILVQGDASVQLSPAGACAAGSCAQVYTITQVTTVTTVTTVTVDKAANQTQIAVAVNGVAQPAQPTINGIPEQFDPASGAVMGPANMLYVNGNIKSLSGPGEGQTAIQDGTALTVTAANSVTITGDIKYRQEPVTLTGTTQTPIDTLIPANDTRQVLGIFTATGDIQMSNKQTDNNLEIDASLATISQGGAGGLINSGNQINLLTIVGGRIQNQIKNIGTTTRNVLFDRRFQGGNFAPPFFPSTTVNPGKSSASFTTSLSRVAWKDQSATY